MTVVRAFIALLFVAAVAGAVIVAQQGSPVKAAGQPLGFVPPATGQKLVIIGDGYSTGTPMGGVGDANWATMLGRLNDIQVLNKSAKDVGYVSTPDSGTPAFPARALAVAKQRPDYVIVWGARADIRPNIVNGSEFQSKVTKTLTTLTNAVPPKNVVVVGPVRLPWDEHPALYAKADQIEKTTAQGLGATYIDALDWFNVKDGTASFIGQDGQYPTNDGALYITNLMQQNLYDDNVGLAQNPPAFSVSSAVPPYIASTITTATPPTKVVPTTITRSAATSFVTRTAIATVTAVVTQTLLISPSS